MWNSFSSFLFGTSRSIIQLNSCNLEFYNFNFPFVFQIACKFSAMSVLQEEKNGKQNDTNLLANAEATQMPSSRGICNFCNTYVASEVLEIHQVL